MKKLPIGIQTFAKIRDKSENYIYIDKTKIALNLIENGEYYFLSRPRRFGKSLFLDTLRAIFAGEKELFEGLYIYDKYDFKPYPIININFGIGVIKDREDLNKRTLKILKHNQKKLNIECEEINDIRECFSELIELAYEKYNQKVVILVDEYDKPILDRIEDIEIAKEIREGLKNFYSVIKGNDEYVKFAFLTGVSKFSKTSIFSGLNNLEDITLDENYSTICGYTGSDIEIEFNEHLKDVDMQKLKLWYNGYNFLGERVYNPFDILLFISKNKTFRNYWFETGTPTFLINLLKTQKYHLPEFENIEAEENLIDSFDIENISIETLMFQSGYLTIKEMITKRNKIKYILDFPNMEVKVSLFDYLLNTITNPIEKSRIADRIYDIFEEANLNELEATLKRLFASIAYQNFTNNYIENYEGFYASVVYAYLASLGIELIGEDVTNRGRIDLTIKFGDRVYIFEFKVIEIDGENKAIKQIKEKRYYEKYLNYKEVYLIGVEFSKDERNIKAYEWEKFLTTVTI